MNAPILGATNYSNMGSLLHSNLGPSVLRDGIAEYAVTIDSAHRDVKRYPNPWKYQVVFDPRNENYDMRPRVDANGVQLTSDNPPQPVVDQVRVDHPGPVIREPLKRVKWIRLDGVHFPRSRQLDPRALQSQSSGPANARLDTENALLDGDRFTILTIPELVQGTNAPCRYGTSEKLSQALSVLVDSYAVNSSWTISEGAAPLITFKEARDIQRLTIEFSDSAGKPIIDPKITSCNICRDKPRYNEEEGQRVRTGAYITDIGSGKTTANWVGNIQVRNAYGLILITGTITAGPLTGIVDVRIDPSKRISGSFCGRSFNTSLVHQDWHNGTNSGVLETETISYRGSLSGAISGVLRMGLDGIDWWTHINTNSALNVTSTGITGIIWSQYNLVGKADDASVHNILIDDGALVLTGHQKEGRTTATATRSWDTAATLGNYGLGTVAPHIGAYSSVLTATNLTANLETGVGANAESITVSGTPSVQQIAGKFNNLDVSGEWNTNIGDTRIFSTTGSKHFVSAWMSTGYRNHIRVQGWFTLAAGGDIYVCATIEPGTGVVGVYIYNGVPGVFTGSLAGDRVVGSFENRTGSAGTFNIGWTSGRIVFDDGSQHVWNGSNGALTTVPESTIDNLSVSHGVGHLTTTGFASGMAFWDPSACSCQIHPLDPRIQNTIFMTVGVAEQDIPLQNPYQV
jgi:hypothetical protein